jgi:hypothetical protein
MPSWKTPTAEQLDHTISLLARPEQQRYFFDKLQNPNWLNPLEERGFFNNPPPAIRDRAKGIVNYPPWPASHYLSRMAALPEAQQDVLRIARNIPTTDNIMVHKDLATIAATLPPSMAAELSTHAATWLTEPFDQFISEQLGIIIKNLSEHNEPTAATALARTCLSLTTKGHDVAAHFDPWHYGELLKASLPSLTSAIGIAALQLLADLLETAAPPYTRPDGTNTREDGSRTWHPDITVDEELHGIKNHLVNAIRNTAQQLAHKSRDEAEQVIEALRTRPTLVFQRLRMNAIRAEKDQLPGLVTATLTDRTNFDDHGLHYEYQALLRDAFTTLDASDQATILSWINSGPSQEQYEAWEQWIGGTPTPEQQERYTKLWQRRQLHPIRDHLTGTWKDTYDAVVKEYGPEEPPQEGGFIGPASPITQGELAQKTPEDLIAYLIEWVPITTGDFSKPSRAGLALELQSRISEDPTLFDTVIDLVRGLHPTYVRSYYYGLREAIEKHKSIRWNGAISVAAWVVQQPAGAKTTLPFTEDTSWADAHSAILDLLDRTLTIPEGKPGSIPTTHRKDVWLIISTLTIDPDPTPTAEAQYACDLDAPLFAANTTRGKAIEGAVKYALWLRNNGINFADVPEVRQVLDEHLTTDPSIAIHSIYGRFFPWLVVLDKAWAKENRTTIFDGAAGSVAWEAYVTFSPAYDDVAGLLTQYYERAIVALDPGRQPPARTSKPDPDEHLGEHLMAQYWRDRLALQQSMLSRFFDRAPIHARAHVMAYAGRSLSAHKGSISESLRDRLVSLWEFRRDKSDPTERSTFGWWFATGKLDPNWSLDQLKYVLTTAHAVDNDHHVIKELARLAPTHSAAVMECLRILLTVGPPWLILGAEQHVTNTLSTILQSENADARKDAVSFIHGLGTKGHTKFRSLVLKEAPEGAPAATQGQP